MAALPKVLLFDLGGVLVEFDGIASLQRLSGGRLTAEEARRLWLLSPWAVRFETGQCTPLEFAEGLVADMGFDLTPEAFLADFKAWERGPFPGALELLDALRPGFILACLTNNNALHWQIIRERDALDRRFHHCFASHETGLAKPDPRAFEHVVGRIGLPANQFAFFDDNPESVAAAARVGMQACLTRGLPAVREALTRLGVEISDLKSGI